MVKIVIIAIAFFVSACSDTDSASDNLDNSNPRFISSVDLSSVNELLDCGAVFKDKGIAKNPYQIFKDHGATQARFRLWHTPAARASGRVYNDINDLIRSIKTSKDLGLEVLLDFHYSDDWADPAHQIIPKAWAKYVNDTARLEQEIYNYTYATLEQLANSNLAPDMVQLGNEVDSGILYETEWTPDFKMDWTRTAKLLNSALKAVLDINEKMNLNIETMIHIAKPEYAEVWFKNAFDAGLSHDFNYIGVSYYTAWSALSLKQLGAKLRRLNHLFQIDTFLAEVAYPWTLVDADGITNINHNDAVEDSYPASISGQRQFLIDLTQELISNGVKGLSYWEPAWIGKACNSGSPWDNMTLLNNDSNELHAGADFLSYDYKPPVSVSFEISTDDKSLNEIFLWASFIGGNDFAIKLNRNSDGIFTYVTYLPDATRIEYQLLKYVTFLNGKLVLTNPLKISTAASTGTVIRDGL